VHLQGGRGPSIDGREELGRLAAVGGAAGFAIVQPVLDAFGRSPETFIFRDAVARDVLTFAFAVAVLPAVALWFVGFVVGVLAPRWRDLVHGATVGLLAGLGVVQVLASAARPVAVAGAIGAVGAAWVLTVRAEPFRMWSRWFAVLPAGALLTFLVASPSSDLLASGDFQAVASGRGDLAPVVLVVLDELPTASIIDAAGRIDEQRFPNLARLAEDGTWYRNHTTVNGFTTHAVPAILTGKLPRRGANPLFTDHPDNLFRLLAGSHDLVVSESLTRLCPRSVCGERPQAPGAGEAPSASRVQMAALFGDALDLWLERIGGGDDASGHLAASAEEPVEVASDSFGGDEDPGSVAEWDQEVGHEPERLTEFLDALQPADKPIAAVLHLVSPHFPWRHLPDGTTYAEPADGSDLAINGGNGGVPWIADLERQRHLLQASYTDALVGRILDRLEEVDLYDEAVVVVTADHGIAFHGDQDRRLPVQASLPEIMWTPLIVKGPGQTEPEVDDSNVQTIDILPTMAHLIGVDLPWPVDGVAAGSADQRERGERKLLHTLAGPGVYESGELLEVDGRRFAEVLRSAFPPVGDGTDLLAPLHELSGHGELVGQPFEPDGAVPSDTFEIDDLDRLLRGEDLPLLITGSVAGGSVDEDAVVAVSDGRIVAVSPVVFRNIGGAAFAMLLPLDGSADLASLRLALVRDGEVLDGGEVA
jgi:hypothetical protein